MFYNRQRKNIFYLFISCTCVLLSLTLGLFFLMQPKKVWADEMPSYLNISTNSASYGDGDTIFLDENEVLNITFGKPLQYTPPTTQGGITTIHNHTQSEIGEYALNKLDTAFSLKINNEQVALGGLRTAGLLQFENYVFQAEIQESGEGTAKTFMFFSLQINLTTQSEFFSSGEYTFSFTNYQVNSGSNFTYTDIGNLSFTVYLFKTTEYFDNSSCAVKFDNVEKTNQSLSASFRNYYYFNYSNLNSTTSSQTSNLLPKLSFDASKFVVDISKSVAGNRNGCTISKFNQDLVTLNSTTSTQFIRAIYHPETNIIDVIFNDIGEYVLEYTFIFERYNHEQIELNSLEISATKEKNDVLYVFGYQMYYGGVVAPENEFKTVENDRTKTYQSADVTYLVSKTDSTYIKSASQVFADSDELIKSSIAGISPVSTNQPAVIVNSNVTLATAHSHYYKYNSDTSQWGNLIAFGDEPFTATGTYLLRTVYSYDYYGQGSSTPTYFVQYFYFKIDNTIPSVILQEDTTEQRVLLNNSYTKNSTKVILDGQSPFNSAVKVEVFAKNFESANFLSTPSAILNSQETATFAKFDAQGNYMVKLLYGKSLNKTKYVYFTIDLAEISGVSILPVNKDEFTNNYIKDTAHPVNFFTSEKVVVQWNEKRSGASTRAYFKYVPFTSNSVMTPDFLQSAVSGVLTNQQLKIDPEKIYDKAGYSNALSKVNSSNVFSNQGLYIMYITDEAGHERYTYFCIDRSPIQVVQIDAALGSKKLVSAYDLVSANKILSWGDYKLIPIKFETNNVPQAGIPSTIADPWIATTISSLYNPQLSEASPTDSIHSLSSNLYFTVEICKVFGLRTGIDLKLITNQTDTESRINITSSTYDGLTYANEITYSYFFMDEGNKNYSYFMSLQNRNPTQSDAQNFALVADKNFQITTSTDASNAQILLNSTQNIQDVSPLGNNATPLMQAGFADSATDPQNPTANIRSKYYFSTGTTNSTTVTILGYKIKLNINEVLNVSKITMYHYPFITNELGNKTLSSTAQKTVLYDILDPATTSLLALSGANNENYYGVNINVDYDNLTNEYITLPGKYVIVREYDNLQHINQYDFLVRDSVFIVDRESIVSTPETISGTTKSAVGGGIFVNILEGNQNAVKFTNIYSATNNNNTYILQTNKLPVVVYVPVAKYGQNQQNPDKSFSFQRDEIIGQFLKLENNQIVRVSYSDNAQTVTSHEKATPKLIYFGGSALTDYFDTNPQVYKNQDFDLSVTVTKTTGEIISTFSNGLGYIASNPILATGTYVVTITQNQINGLTYPNVFNTFKFSFQIIEAPPTFVYVDQSETNISNSFEVDKNGVFYTNQEGKIKVMWSDPNDTTYFAKVDTSADANGTTQIYYYFVGKDGSRTPNTYVFASEIITDVENPNVHSFEINLANFVQPERLDNAILHVYMQNERGTVVGGANNLLLANLTSVTKKLFIDRSAPSQILDSLIAKTQIGGIKFADYTRKYVNLDGTDAPQNTRLYNVPLTSGALAKYAFAVMDSAQTPLNTLFSAKEPVNSYYTEGYYYRIQEIADIAQYTLPNLRSAIATAKASQTQYFQFVGNRYYEVVEIDLAGNVAIYLIYVATTKTDQDNTDPVLQFNRQNTDQALENQILHNSLFQNPTQDIFAKDYLTITNLAMNNYKFTTFMLDNEIYFMSSALINGQCYSFSSMTTPTVVPEMLNIETLLHFQAPSHHTLVINNSIKGTNYTVNLYVTNQQLSYNLLNNAEGINIVSPTQPNNIKQYLASIKISKYDKSSDTYVVIYDKFGEFASDRFVTVSGTSTNRTFTIISPELAYSYVFYDNYGQKYSEHHTAGSFVLNEKDKVKNYLEKVSIAENETSNFWYVAQDNVIYNYSSADYFAYIKISKLTTHDGIIEWFAVNFDPTNQNSYGEAISEQSNYVIADGANISCTISTSAIHPTVKQLILYAPAQNALTTNFAGGVYKFEITLVDQYSSLNQDTIVDRVLINNLTPIVDLKDKNLESVFEEDAIYSEQLTISIPTLPETITTNSLFSNFMLIYSAELVFNQTSSPLISGLVVDEAGNYEIKVFGQIKGVIGGNKYLLASKPFIISNSETAFYKVLVRDPTTGIFNPAKMTGQQFTYNNTICYNHYIVNDEFDVFLNKNQFMENQVLSNGGVSPQVITENECTTYIYTISNFAYAATNNISPYYTTFAVSYIPKSSSIITRNLFAYETNDGSNKQLNDTSTYVAITQSDSEIDRITIKFNSYYAIAENMITATVQTENQVWEINSKNSTSNGQTTAFDLEKSGDYTITFADIAGNVQLFTDANGIEQVYYYKIRFIKGVAYLINGQAPIPNAIYNDSVVITLPPTLANVYDLGGKPTIVVFKNDKEIKVTPVAGKYTLNESGFYRVFFNARVKDKELRQETYEFLIMSSNEYKSNFEFTEYGNYEISSIIKNNQDFTANVRTNYRLSKNDVMRRLSLSLYDEKTGEGKYTLTIKTNSGKNMTTENGQTVPESFTFSFIIKAVGIVPIIVSISEGSSTTNAILVEFNAFDLYQDIGECKIVYGKQELKINQEYLGTLNEQYYCSLPITETGTHFVQVYNSSDTLLYSYKVIKTEPLNTVSILLIVAGALAVAGLTVTIVLLRKRMKIK